MAAAALSIGLAACAPKAAPRVTVKTAAARAGRIVKNIEFSGVLVPDRTLNIYAKIAGQATSV